MEKQVKVRKQAIFSSMRVLQWRRGGGGREKLVVLVLLVVLMSCRESVLANRLGEGRVVQHCNLGTSNNALVFEQSNMTGHKLAGVGIFGQSTCMYRPRRYLDLR